MNWKRIMTIARWEYMQKIRSKAFILSLVLTPALIIGFGVLPTMLADTEPDETKVIGIVDQTGQIASQLKQSIESSDKLANGEPAWLISMLPERPVRIRSGDILLVARRKSDPKSGHRAGEQALARTP